MSRAKALAMGEAPYAYDKRTSASMVWGTSAALAPALAWGLYCFGASAALPIAASIIGALAGEAIASGMRRRFTLLDGSAFLTGLLVGLAMPPGITPFIPATASFFSVAVVKGAFGGLGSNWMNPALAGIAFAFLDWPAEMGSWALPRHLTGIDGISGATPLGLLRSVAGQGGIANAGTSPMELLTAGGMRFSGIDASVTDALNGSVFSHLGAELPGGYIDLLLGNKAGALGELSALLILAASVFLISRRIVRWEIPASLVGSFALFTWTFGGIPLGEGLFSGDVLFSLFSGSFLLIAFFMAPDPVTSPSSRIGMLLYGTGIGALIFLSRRFGASAEGGAFAVILMNCAVPSLAKLEINSYRRRAAKAAALASALEGDAARGNR